MSPLPGRSTVLLFERQLAPALAARRCKLLGALDALDEPRIRTAKRELRVDVEAPRQVDDREEDVADLVRDLRVGLGLGGGLTRPRDLRLELAELLSHLGERPFEVGPVEARGDRTPLQLPRLQERGQRGGNVVEDPLAPLLLGLDLLPALADAARRVGLDLAEDVWMAADELGVHCPRNLLEIAVALLLQQEGEEVDLEEEVAELVEQLGRIARIGGVRDLVGLLDGMRDDRPRRLLAVPGAVAAQAPRQLLQLFQRLPLEASDYSVAEVVVLLASGGGVKPVA